MIIFCVCDAVLHAAGLRGSHVDYLDSECGNFRCSRASKRWLLLQRFRSSRLWSFFRQGFPQVTRFAIYFTSYNITRLTSFVNYSNNDVSKSILAILRSKYKNFDTTYRKFVSCFRTNSEKLIAIRNVDGKYHVYINEMRL